MEVSGDLLALYRERLEYTLMQLITRELSNEQRTTLTSQKVHWQKKIEEAQDAHEDHAR